MSGWIRCVDTAYPALLGENMKTKNIFVLPEITVICKNVFVVLLAILITVDNQAIADPILEEITVTATRRATSALDTGVSLSAITEETLERDGLDSFADFATSVAGLSFGQRGPGQSIIVLRGVNSSTTQFNTDEPEAKASVGVYFDDTPVSLGGYNPDPRLFDINRIEVLRGPQGTLFGAGSMSGTIRYISNAPDPSAFDSKVNVGYSNTDSGGNNYEFNGMLNMPLGNIAAARGILFRRDIDGFIDNAGRNINPDNQFAPSELENVNTDETNGGRFQLLIQPTDNLSLTGKVYYQKTNTGGYPTTDGAGPTNTADATLGDLQQDRTVEEPTTDEFKLFSFDLDYDMGFAELTSVTSYMERDLDQDFEQTDFLPFFGGLAALPDPDRPPSIPAIFSFLADSDIVDPSLIGPLNNVTETEDWVQEIRLVSNTDHPFQWILGFFYNQQDKLYTQDAPSPGAVVDQDAVPIPFENVFRSAQTFDERQYAVFGEVSYEFNEAFKGIVGLRYFDFKQDMVFTPDTSLLSSGLSLDTTTEEDGINPKFSLEWRPLDDTLVYTTAAKGFRLGGINDPLPNACGGRGGDSIESDSLWNYEIGYKKDADRFNFSGAAYFIDWKDAPVTATFTCGFGTTLNGPDIQSIGLEGEAVVAVTDNLIVNANASYTKAEFADNFTDGDFSVRDGTEAPLVPRFAFNFGATYFFPVAGHEGYVGANYSFQGERYNQANLANRVQMDAYGILNLKAGLDMDQFRANLFVENVTDQREVIFTDNIFLFHNRDSINRPRTIGVSVTYQF